MLFTARPIDAGGAFAIGLVDMVADDIFNNDLLRLGQYDAPVTALLESY
jgi:hypothetical protein